MVIPGLQRLRIDYVWTTDQWPKWELRLLSNLTALGLCDWLCPHPLAGHFFSFL
jgi:hypothetical protein